MPSTIDAQPMNIEVGTACGIKWWSVARKRCFCGGGEAPIMGRAGAAGGIGDGSVSKLRILHCSAVTMMVSTRCICW